MRGWTLIVGLMLIATSVRADQALTGPITPGLQMGAPMTGKVGGINSGGGGGGCTGTIDLSTGCVQPMLGGVS